MAGDAHTSNGPACSPTVPEPVTDRFDPAWRTADVVALARGIAAEAAWDRMPILADALQDAGCEHPEVLEHCWGAADHTPGCWVIELILSASPTPPPTPSPARERPALVEAWRGAFVETVASEGVTVRTILAIAGVIIGHRLGVAYAGGKPYLLPLIMFPFAMGLLFLSSLVSVLRRRQRMRRAGHRGSV